MSTPAVLLDLIGQALLPGLADPAAPLDGPTLARAVWAGWAPDRDPARRRADLEALLECSADMLRPLAADVVRRLLPGRAGPAQAALGRYLAVLPACLRRSAGLDAHSADDLLRWLPLRIPHWQAFDRPGGVGDRELLEPIRVSPAVECWLARNPLLPALPPVLLAFSDRDGGRATVDWHRRLREAGTPAGVVPLEHTFLDAQPPCFQVAGPAPDPPAVLREPGSRHAGLFRQVVEIVARLHRLAPPLSLGRLDPADVLIEGGTPRLLVLAPRPGATPRDDVRQLGRLCQVLLGRSDETVASLLAECTASDPLLGPADAAVLLERLGSATAPTRSPTSAGSPRRGARVRDVLGAIGTPEPELAKLIGNSIGMKFVLIPDGIFLMGSPPEEAGRRDNEGPVHEVLLARPYYLAVHPVTQAQYQAVVGHNPSRFQGAAGGEADHPVECVSWDDAAAFCRKLGELPGEKDAGRSYRLPTEAQWEHACRAAAPTPFHSGASLAGSQACFDAAHPYGDAPRGPSATRTSRVGAFAANRFGLYDMHGNVWEWCADWFDADYYRASPRQDPPGPATGTFRVLRGGSWRNQASTCRAAYRNALAPNQRQPTIGFRVVLVVSGG